MADKLLKVNPGLPAGRANSAGQNSGLRNGVGGHTRVDRAPHQHGAVTWVDATRQHPGQPGDQRAEPVDEVGGQVWTRRVPARRIQRDFYRVGRRRDGALPNGDLADFKPGIAVQGEDPRHPGQRAGRDRVDGTTGHQFLGRLEDQPHPHRQLRYRSQCQCGTQQDRGVRIMATSMRDVGHGRGVGRAGPLGHRQRIHIGAQRDPRLMLRTEVAGESRSTGQHLGVQPASANRSATNWVVAYS